MQQQIIVLKCPCCEQSSTQLLCLSCGHSICQRCVSVFTQKKRYFKCYQCGQFIVQQPVPNHYLNELAQQLQRNAVQNIEPKITKREFCYQSSFTIQEDFQPMQLTLNQTIVILHNSHSRYKDYMSLKFITQLSKMLYVDISIQKGDKSYQINKQIDFTDAKSVVLPIGPRSKLFEKQQKSLFTITVSALPTRLALLAQAIFTAPPGTALDTAQINQNIEGLQGELAALDKDEALQFLRHLLKQEQTKAVFYNKHIQGLIVRSEVLFNTGDFRLLGQQLNFEALKDLIKQAKAPRTMSTEPDFVLESPAAAPVLGFPGPSVIEKAGKASSLASKDLEHADQVLKSALLQEREERIAHLEAQLTQLRENTIPKAEVQRLHTTLAKIHQQNKQLTATSAIIKENNLELTERLSVAVAFLQRFDIINTPLSSRSTKSIVDMLSPERTFYSTGIPLIPGNLTVASSSQVSQKVVPDEFGRVLVPLNMNSKLKVTVTPLQNPMRFKLLKAQKFAFGARALLGNEALHKLCVFLAEGNDVLIE